MGEWVCWVGGGEEGGSNALQKSMGGWVEWGGEEERTNFLCDLANERIQGLQGSLLGGKLGVHVVHRIKVLG